MSRDMTALFCIIAKVKRNNVIIIVLYLDSKEIIIIFAPKK